MIDEGCGFKALPYCRYKNNASSHGEEANETKALDSKLCAQVPDGGWLDRQIGKKEPAGA